MAAQQKINIVYQWLNGRTQSRTPQVSGPLGTFCSGAKTSCSSLFPAERAVFLPLEWTFRAETHFNSDTIKLSYCGREERHPI